MTIRIHSDQTKLKKLGSKLKKLAVSVCRRLKLDISSLDVIFVDMQTLRQMHKIYLQDDSPSDVLTFNLAEGKKIEGEIYISLDQAEDQARFYHITLLEEICRLIIHGCLHLAGFDDSNSSERRIMKKKEDLMLQSALSSFKKKYERTPSKLRNK